jgi:23S rRNA-/tRNA-specific pseudouridylate synthase
LRTPILGDVKYGSTPKHEELLLHAYKLEAKELSFDISAPLPEYFTRFLKSNDIEL